MKSWRRNLGGGTLEENSSWKNPGGGILEEELLEDEFLGGGILAGESWRKGPVLEEESWRPSTPRPSHLEDSWSTEGGDNLKAFRWPPGGTQPRWHPETPRRPPGAKRLLGLKTCPNHGVSWLKVVHFTCARATDPHPVW